MNKEQNENIPKYNSEDDLTYSEISKKSISLSLPIFVNGFVYFMLIMLIYIFSRKDNKIITESIGFFNLYYNIMMVSIIDGWIIPFEIDGSGLFAKKKYNKLIRSAHSVQFFISILVLAMILFNLFILRNITTLILSKHVNEHFYRILDFNNLSLIFYAQYLFYFRFSNIIQKNSITLLINLIVIFFNYFFAYYIIETLNLENTGVGITNMITHMIFFMLIFVYYLINQNVIKDIQNREIEYYENIKSSKNIIVNLPNNDNDIQEEINKKAFSIMDYGNFDLNYLKFYVSYGFPIFFQYVLVWFCVEAISLISLFSSEDDFNVFGIYTSYNNIVKVLGITFGNTSYVLCKYYYEMKYFKTIWKVFIINNLIYLILQITVLTISYFYMEDVIHLYTKSNILVIKAKESFVLMLLMIFSQSFSTLVRMFLISLNYIKGVLLIVIIGPFLIQTPLALIAAYKSLGLFWILISVVFGQFLMLIAYFSLAYHSYKTINKAIE